MKDKSVWNRDELKGAIVKIVENKKGGTFACLLGGKNTGKSLVLNHLEGDYLNKMFILDLRGNPNMLQGLLDALKERDPPSPASKANEAAAAAAVRKCDINFSDFLENLKVNYGKNFTLENVINELLNYIGDVITIVIDEANIAFTPIVAPDNEKINETRKLLNFFTQLTKQTKRVSEFIVYSYRET